MRLPPISVSVAALVAVFTWRESAAAATLQTQVEYGGSGAIMNVYVPDSVPASPGIVVALHYCGGSAQNAASWLTSLSEQHGFVVIAPSLPGNDADGCWDVGSAQSLTHDGGSHSKAIVEMVEYAVGQYGADASRVFAAGASSGAMLTNVLLGAYPDVFAAGSALAGVPFGCWTSGDGWTSACADGNTQMSAMEWGDLVRNAYPGYAGTRPRVQLFHGTADTTLNYANLAEAVKQWTNVLGLPDAPSSTEQDTPASGFTRTTYQDEAGAVLLEVNIGQDVAHDLTGSGLWDDVIGFFGLDQDVAATTTSSTNGADTSTTTDGGTSIGTGSGAATGAGGMTGATFTATTSNTDGSSSSAVGGAPTGSGTSGSEQTTTQASASTSVVNTANVGSTTSPAAMDTGHTSETPASDSGGCSVGAFASRPGQRSGLFAILGMVAIGSVRRRPRLDTARKAE